MDKPAINAADEANRLHDEINAAIRTSIQKAIRIGEILTQQKAKCGHGNWIPWFKANIQFSLKTADRYRYLYERRDKFVTITNLGLTDAYRLLTEVSDEKHKEVSTEDIPKQVKITPEVGKLLKEMLTNPEEDCISILQRITKDPILKQKGVLTPVGLNLPENITEDQWKRIGLELGRFDITELIEYLSEPDNEL
jgi:hypothetical protein